MRHIVNFGLLFTFTVVGVTGILSFFLPFDLITTRFHIVFGFLTLLLVGMHLWSRVRYFKQKLSNIDKDREFKTQLISMAALFFILLVTAWIDMFPVKQMIRLGYEASFAKEIVRPSILTGLSEQKKDVQLARKGKDSDRIALTFHGQYGELIENQDVAVAIWAESSVGAMIETLYVSPELAYETEPMWNGETTPRYKILPVWRHRYSTLSGVDPLGRVDGVSGATKNHAFTLDKSFHTDASDYILYLEINVAGDTNEYWEDNHYGQPSVLYSSYVDHYEDRKYYLMELTGHGGEAESSGEINYDLSSITTAKNALEIGLISSLETTNIDPSEEVADGEQEPESTYE